MFAKRKVVICIGVLAVLIAVSIGFALNADKLFQPSVPQEQNENIDLAENENLAAPIASEIKEELAARSSQRLDNSTTFTLSGKDIQLWISPLKNLSELFNANEEIYVLLRPMSATTDLYYEGSEKDSLEAYSNASERTDIISVSDLENFSLQPKTSATISSAHTEHSPYSIIVINHDENDKTITECPIVFFSTDLSSGTAMTDISCNGIELKTAQPDDILKAFGTPYEELYTDQNEKTELKWNFQNEQGSIAILFDHSNKVISASFDALYDNIPMDFGNTPDLAGITLKSTPIFWKPTVSIQQQNVILGETRLSDLKELGIDFTTDLDQISPINEIAVSTSNADCLLTVNCLQGEPISNGIICAVSTSNSDNSICGLSSGSKLSDLINTLGQPIERYGNWVTWQSQTDVPLQVEASIEGDIATQISISISKE